MVLIVQVPMKVEGMGLVRPVQLHNFKACVSTSAYVTMRHKHTSSGCSDKTNKT
jgi:hypothetical protein